MKTSIFSNIWLKSVPDWPSWVGVKSKRDTAIVRSADNASLCLIGIRAARSFLVATSRGRKWPAARFRGRSPFLAEGTVRRLVVPHVEVEERRTGQVPPRRAVAPVNERADPDHSSACPLHRSEERRGGKECRSRWA